MRRTKMAVSKKNPYIDLKLEWLENKAEEWKKYCDDRPWDKLKDRTDVKGRVVSKVEDQIKCIRETMKDYVLILEAINNLSQKEEMKKSSPRGDQALSPIEAGEI